MLLTAFSGGLLIGIAALLLYACAGRIAGISGITYGLFWQADKGWRATFLLAMIGGGWLMSLLVAPVDSSLAVNRLPQLVLAGLLVGLGTQMGNGCTSGHGVCGLARLSRRSLAAVAVFMGIGMAVATGAQYWP